MIKHPTLPYYGIVDCIAKIDGFGWAVIDWKTSDRRKQELNECWDDPIQIAAYCAMLGLNRGALVKMYEDKNPDVIMMEPDDVNYYWQLFAERYDVYVERNRRFIKN